MSEPTRGSSTWWQTARDVFVEGCFEHDGVGFWGFVHQFRHSNTYFVLSVLRELGEGTMARGKAGKPEVAKSERQQWTAFVAVALPEELEFADIEAWAGDATEVWPRLNELLVDGYRASWSYNDQADQFTCSLTGRTEENPNNGLTLTAQGFDWYSALLVALYKHIVLCDQSWSAFKAEKRTGRIG